MDLKLENLSYQNAAIQSVIQVFEYAEKGENYQIFTTNQNKKTPKFLKTKALIFKAAVGVGVEPTRGN
ncbi:MAG: hypothetical protein PW786_12910 [Arachidicoccus sp.]|nr:hypothetical protein [Arachidicoccus sp.]